MDFCASRGGSEPGQLLMSTSGENRKWRKRCDQLGGDVVDFGLFVEMDGCS